MGVYDGAYYDVAHYDEVTVGYDPNTALYLRISQGTQVFDLAPTAVAGRKYGLQYNSWYPDVARFIVSELGARVPYEDCVEELPLRAYGATAGEALTNLRQLVHAISYADRWLIDPDQPATYLDFRNPNSGTGIIYRTIIIGLEQNPVQVDPIAMHSLSVASANDAMIASVTLRVRRIGAWFFYQNTSDNLISNFGFDYYGIAGYSAVSGTAVGLDTAFAFQGSSSAQVSTTGSIAGQGVLLDEVPATPGVQYTFSSQYYQNGAPPTGGCSIVIAFYNASHVLIAGGTFSTNMPASTIRSNTWDRYYVQASAPVGTAYARGSIITNVAQATVFHIDALRLSAGPWSAFVPTTSAATTALNYGLTLTAQAIGTISFPWPADMPSPLEVRLEGLAKTTFNGVDPGAIFAYSYDVNRLKTVSAFVYRLGGSTYQSNVTDPASNYPVSTLLRFTPTAILYPNSMDTTGPITVPSNVRAVAVFVTMRINTVGTSIWLGMDVTDNWVYNSLQNLRKFSYSDGHPHVYYLGTLFLQGAPASGRSVTVALRMGTEAATGTYDFDTINIVPLEDDAEGYLVIDQITYNNSFSSSYRFVVDGTILDKPQGLPFVGTRDTSTPPFYMGTTYRGDPHLLTKGDSVSAMLIATFGTAWRPTNTTPAAQLFSLLGRRDLALLVPE